MNGLSVPADEQRASLERLGFEVGGEWQVTVPEIGFEPPPGATVP